MDYTILIIVLIIWFFVSVVIFQRKLIKKHASTVKERVMTHFTQIQFILFIKKDKELTPWIIQIWISFILFLTFILINYLSE